MSTATMTRPAPRPALRPVALPAGLRLEPVRAVSRRAPRLRLTRRGRLVLLVLCSLILLAIISVGRAGSQAATATETGPTLQQTTVQPGETLWAVAQRIAPDNDPRQVVAQIRRINNLTSSGLQAGQQLLLPVPAR
ncbi:MAG: LysM peptidoglycan-binding domain-containing protein [Frankiaceae bacterium]|nr:LysM peptidoglycan-binding domain-containing protein [Frankiaceae bacterium]